MKQGDPDESGNWFRTHKVEVISLFNGYPHDRELANKHLTLGGIYTVKHTWVWPAHSEVELVEFPDIRFNTINFKEANNDVT